MSSPQPQHMVQDSAAVYEKAEMDLLHAALKRSYAERFKMMTTLMKMNAMFRRAKITRKPYIPPAETQ